MGFFSRSFSARGIAAGVLAASLGLAAQDALAQSTPSAIAGHGRSLGLESPSAPVSATVWLNLHNKAEFDAAVKQIYTKGSPTYHKWMTKEDLKRFQPTTAEVESVKSELAAHHLSVLSADQGNYSVKFAGKISDYESAFHTQVGRYKLGTQVVRVASVTPQLTGVGTGLVSAVSGVKGVGLKSFHVVPLDPKTHKQMGLVRVASNKPQGAIFSNQCISALSASVTLSGPGAMTAKYSGLGYGADPNNTVDGTISPCGYSPQDVWQLYHLNPVYLRGFTGAGQTVVIVDAYGSPTITADATAFSSIYGLPAPTAANFKIYTPTPVTASDAGWAEETTLDVEWAHAIAPEANIALIAARSPSDDDLQSAVLYAINNNLGNVISNSYGEPESEDEPATMTTWNQICEVAAARGISVHFSTGDSGDYAAELGYTDVSSPANAPYATAVGGTSMAFSPFDGSTIQTGWGGNITELSPGGNTVDDPPYAFGFQGGSGGGISHFFAKSDYQSALAGASRHLPDVSAIADPYTGVEIVFTISGVQYFEVIGGTSLASPVFSGMWALVDQYYAQGQGQAAPYIAAGSPLIVDVLPAYDAYNVAGSITDAAGTTQYSSVELSEPLEATTMFGAALWNYGGGAFYNLTFGTDSSLTVTPGWDNVTGYGTPSFAVIPPPAD